jgi:hypothetical protein
MYDRGRHAEYRAAWDALSGALRLEQSGPQGAPPAGVSRRGPPARVAAPMRGGKGLDHAGLR